MPLDTTRLGASLSRQDFYASRGYRWLESEPRGCAVMMDPITVAGAGAVVNSEIGKEVGKALVLPLAEKLGNALADLATFIGLLN